MHVYSEIIRLYFNYINIESHNFKSTEQSGVCLQKIQGCIVKTVLKSFTDIIGI